MAKADEDAAKGGGKPSAEGASPEEPSQAWAPSDMLLAAVPGAAVYPTVAFSLVVVQHPVDGTYCLVHEKDNRGWWLPGGGIVRLIRFCGICH